MTNITRPVSILPKGTDVSRYLQVLGLAKGYLTDARDIAEQHFTDTPHIAKALEVRGQKAAVSAVGSDFFEQPVIPLGIGAEALLLLRELSLTDRVFGRANRVPFVLPSPKQTGTGAGGSWVGEGTGTPLVAFAFGELRLQPCKSQVLIAVSRELLKLNNPGAEVALRNVVLGAAAQFLDGQLLDPTLTPTPDNPASITAGGTAVTSTGTTAAQMAADFGAMIAAITTRGRGLVWIMRPTTAARIALVLGAAAADLPRTFLGLPVILSGNSPAQITLVDADAIAYADDGGFDVEIARSAAIQMDSAPTNSAFDDGGSPADPPTPTTLVSLFQTNAIAFRSTRWINWEVTQTGAVSYMLVSY
jgi:hypothetical protein